MSVTKISQNGKTREVNVNLSENPTDEHTNVFLAARMEHARELMSEIETPLPENPFTAMRLSDAAQREQYTKQITHTIAEWAQLATMLKVLGKNPNFNNVRPDYARAARRLWTPNYPADNGTGVKINTQSIIARCEAYTVRVVKSGAPMPSHITLTWDTDPSTRFGPDNELAYYTVRGAKQWFKEYAFDDRLPNTEERYDRASDLTANGQFEQRAGERSDPKLNELRDTQEGPSTVL